MHTDPSPARLRIEDMPHQVVGVGTPVPLLDGTERNYVFLDNAASTPAFRRVLDAVSEFMPWYSGVHRGTGFKSLLATAVFDGAHEAVARFVGADPATSTVVFVKNTTECVNKMAGRFGFREGDVVITTVMEHHSNDLPWRKHARVVHAGLTPDGHLDLAALREAIRRNAGRLRLVAVSGASNISGLVQPVHEIAGWAHAAGAKIFVDAAQLAPHRRVRMLADDDPGHIDFLAISAHKMYAPFGTGALVGPTSFFREGEPDVVGGGVVDIVTLDEVHWNAPPHREEAGSPNVVGGVALAAAIGVLEEVGMEAVEDHERELLEYAYGKLRRMKGITLYGPTEDLRGKVGVITFNVDGMPHALTAAVLGTEEGIGVRNGCFCAHPYVKELLKVTPEEDRALTAEVLAGNKTRLPGMVRASVGCYNTEADIDALVEALGRIVRREFRGAYVQDRSSGSFHAEGYDPDFARYFPGFAGMAPLGERRHSEAS
jgi:selenocysteine lyase/cysteine desulfurase